MGKSQRDRDRTIGKEITDAPETFGARTTEFLLMPGCQPQYGKRYCAVRELPEAAS